MYTTDEMEKRKSPAPDRIQTLHLSVMRRVLYRCATTAATVLILLFYNPFISDPSSGTGVDTEGNTPDTSRLMIATRDTFGSEARPVGGGLANFLIDRASKNSVLANYCESLFICENNAREQ